MSRSLKVRFLKSNDFSMAYYVALQAPLATHIIDIDVENQKVILKKYEAITPLACKPDCNSF